MDVGDRLEQFTEVAEKYKEQRQCTFSMANWYIRLPVADIKKSLETQAGRGGEIFKMKGT